jgi:hypothetical protein
LPCLIEIVSIENLGGYEYGNKNEYKKEEDYMMWELYEIRNKIFKERKPYKKSIRMLVIKKI